MAARVDQAGLGMPDRDYYLKDDDAQLRAIRGQYLKAIEKLLTLAAQPDAAAQAKSILAFETRIAQAQWPRTDLRDPVKTYTSLPSRNWMRPRRGTPGTATWPPSG